MFSNDEAKRLDWGSEKKVLKEDLCRILVRIGALKFGTFTLADGHLSPYFINLRIVPSFPDVFRRICSIYSRIIEEEIGVASFERFAGIPLSAIPYASCLSFTLKKPLVLVRKEEKLDGRQRRIEGILRPGDRVLPIDDIITTGGNLSSTVKVLRGEGAVVEKAAVLVDREEGGVEKLGKEGVSVYSLMSIAEAAETLYRLNALSKEEYDAILLQRKK